ncbi:MAG: AI-2E family transporter [Endomicrobium sp.]|jgi:predicted PurR-regulated permease PerM|nr:AI-2E family transporter [Endomicrobium sp.]
MATETSNNRIFAISIILFLAGCLFLYFARNILTPFILAAFFTYLLSPLVSKIQVYGYKRWVAVALFAVIFMIAASVALSIIIPALVDEVEKLTVNWNTYYNYVYAYVIKLKDKIETAFPIIHEYKLSETAIERINSFLTSEAQKVPQYIMSIFSLFSVIVLIPMLVLFMLVSGGKGVKAIVEIVPSGYVETFLSVIYEMDSVLGKFIRGQLIEAMFVGTLSCIVLSILGINYALLIGITAGIANMIPYMGPAIGVILASIIALVQFQNVSILIKLIPSFLIIQFLDNNLVQPFVVGQNVDLGPVTMIFAMLAGAQVFGFLGIVFAVPVAAIIKTIFFMLIKKYKNSLLV